MIRDYLNQTAQWYQKTGTNAYGEPEFAAPVQIKVRWEGKRRLVRNAQGEEVVSEARVFCLKAVATGDKLEYGGRQWPVIAVSEMPGLDGGISHYEVAV